MIPSSVKAFIVLLAVLAAGIVLGRTYERRTVERASASPMNPDNVMRVLEAQLALDSVQRVTIKAILTRRQSAIDAAWRTIQPGVRAAVDSSQMEIVDVLRPEQRTKFLTLLRTSHPAPAAMQERP
jgi:ATP-dependent 26S proteasome regulatory subunit